MMVLRMGRFLLWKCLPMAVILTLVFLGVGPSPVGADTPPELKGACAVPSDACWESGFHQPGVSGTVYALVRDNSGNIYVGGEISAAGGVPVNNLAKRLLRLCRGQTGQRRGHVERDQVVRLGGGMDDGVGALAVDANGYLYAGGDFKSAGGTQADHIARWDGFTWSPPGSGADSNVRALAPAGNRLMVGGGSSTTSAFEILDGYRVFLPTILR